MMARSVSDINACYQALVSSMVLRQRNAAWRWCLRQQLLRHGIISADLVKERHRGF
jgi:hypothetical protein